MRFPARFHATSERTAGRAGQTLRAIAGRRVVLRAGVLAVVFLVSRVTSLGASELECDLMTKAHGSAVRSITLSADGRFVLTAAANEAILWELPSGKAIRKYPGPATLAALSPDAKFVVVGGAGEAASLRDAVSGKELRKLPADGGRVFDVAISSDSRQIATREERGPVTLWEISTGKSRAALSLRDAGRYLAFSPDGTRLLMGNVVADISDGNAHQRPLPIAAESRALSGTFSPDSRQALLGTDDGQPVLWDLAAGREIRRFGKHRESFNEAWIGVAILPGTRTIVTISDWRACLWDVSTGKELRSFPTIESQIKRGAVTPDGKILLLGADNGITTLWNIETAVRVGKLTAHPDPVWSVAFSPDSMSVATGTRRGAVLLWGAAEDSVARLLEGHGGAVTGAAFTPDGRSLLTAAHDHWAIRWDARTGEKEHAARIHAWNARGILFLPEGNATVAFDPKGGGTLRLLDMATGAIAGRFQKGPPERISEALCLAIDGTGTQLLAGFQDGLALLWDIPSGVLIRELNQGRSSIRSMAFSPDGKTIVMQAADKTTVLWDAQTGKRLQTLQDFSKPEEAAPRRGFFGPRDESDDSAPAAVAFNHDGTLTFAASSEATLVAWDTATGKQVSRFTGHGADITSVACGRNGKFVITGSIDGTARLWSLATGKELARLVSFDAGRAWAVIAPDLGFDGSENAARYLPYRWSQSNTMASSDEINRCRRKGLLGSLLRAE